MRSATSRIVTLRAVAAALLGALLIAALGASSGIAKSARSSKSPITIGAVVDLTNQMSSFDAPALLAAQLEVKRINAAGGVDGRKLEIKVYNDELDATKTLQGAEQMVADHVDIGWVTCDVNYASPAVEQFINAGDLTISPCESTGEMGPVRFGAKGKLAFSFGNAAADVGAAIAQYAYQKRHWTTADVVTDNTLRYFQNVCSAFSSRFQQLGGKIVGQESFTESDKTIGNVISRVNDQKADVIAFCTAFATDQPAFVAGLRSLKNETPIIDAWSSDGSYWWPKRPPVTNFYFTTPASVFGNDPSPQVRAFEAALKAEGQPAETGGFINGAAAIQGIADAIRKAHGSTNGAKLARVMQRFHNLRTISGDVSFSAQSHTVFGRKYRLMEVNDNKAKFLGLIKASSPANIKP
ncbi:MAG: ABC transporter substrate-binding protein [Solirubrobacteraceae bacterium]